MIHVLSPRTDIGIPIIVHAVRGKSSINPSVHLIYLGCGPGEGQRPPAQARAIRAQAPRALREGAPRALREGRTRTDPTRAPA